MSLQHIAKHMAKHGRGPDTELIHMSKGEVAGLQALAKAHGGSLTINPHTGLAEAGFLNRLLPTLIGAGLMYATGGAAAGALTAGEIGMGVGALQTARTGSLSEGIKAGLGAYGGAGMAGGFMTPTGAEATSATAATPPAAADVPVSDAGVGATQAPAVANPVSTGQVAQQPLPSMPDYGISAQPGQGFTGNPSSISGNLGTSVTGAPSGAASNVGGYADRISAAGNTGPAAGNTGFMQTPSGIGNLSKMDALKYGAASAGSMVDTTRKLPEEEEYSGPLSKYQFDPEKYRSSNIQQPNPYYQARMYNYADGGTVEQMSNANSIGANTGYPMSGISQGAYATPYQTPISRNVVSDASDVGIDSFTGEPRGMAGGGITSLGSYSDGGRMLKGPGDGMSDSIPAHIGSKQPARLADGEFVVPADVVSHLGNGSTDAGARQLYSMMDRIRQQRTGKKKQAPKVNPNKSLPA